MATREQRRQVRIERITDPAAFPCQPGVRPTKLNGSSSDIGSVNRKKTSPPITNSFYSLVPLTVATPSDTRVSTSSLIVRIGQASIELHSGFNPELLREIVHALEKSSC